MSAMSEKPLELKVEERGSAAVVHVKGSVSITNAETMRRKLEELAGRKIPRIILDLSQMDFICSTGLGAIINGHLKCRHHDGQLCLVNPQPAVRQLLEMTRLTKLFPLYASVEQASPA